MADESSSIKPIALLGLLIAWMIWLTTELIQIKAELDHRTMQFEQLKMNQRQILREVSGHEDESLARDAGMQRKIKEMVDFCSKEHR